MHDRLGSAGQNDIGEPRLEVVVRVGDGLGARRAGRDIRAGERARGDGHADRSSGGVRHEHGDRHRQNATRALLTKGVPGIQKRPEAADAGRVVDADADRVHIGSAGIRPRLAGRDERELARRVEALVLNALEHILGAHLGLGGEGHRQVVLRDPLVGEGVGSGFTSEQRGPGVRCRAAERRGGTDAGNNDLLGGHINVPVVGGHTCRGRPTGGRPRTRGSRPVRW